MLLRVGCNYVGTFTLGLFVYYATRPVNERTSVRFGGAGRSALISPFAVVLPFVVILGLVVATLVNAVIGLRAPRPGSSASSDPYLDSLAGIERATTDDTDDVGPSPKGTKRSGTVPEP